MEQPAATEEDPFSEFLSQEPTAPAPPAEGAESLLRLVAESAQRQEQLLGKVCSLLLGLDDKLGRIAAAQERLEETMQRGGGGGGSSGDSFTARGGTAPVPRGNLVAPPGKTSYSGPLGPSAAAGPSPEEQRLAQERLAADRLRMEEENRRRAEELARRREEDERRKREEEERRRQEEERRREEERLRKEELGKKTSGLMSGLLSSSGGGGLFGDEAAPKRSSKGGLFDD
ncbi:unnamed protein product [Effrenium voratum]|uniref:Uncharacterized protein n=2 Tax=Effrenium voratum TaxID=2562239 RepID=A0AA36NLZ7_9DINO|nr:unnamed protein product [Effrenium voratum]CAJ1408383.1 unnamed protein product [Effrenium voratum]CAJ1456761.1 unnamed protein product [Effrenium voratum]|mmetsp:Transcript_96113/g.228913  ORF Transcript_96113/g.228913 Transcript_96113/m.228913 type:complete len:230 (-) Transcript_96113:64-753(-)